MSVVAQGNAFSRRGSPFFAIDAGQAAFRLSLGEGTESIAIRTVVGAVLNDLDEYRAFETQFGAPPYKAAPVRPALYIKPRNTWLASGASVQLDNEVNEVRVAGCLGMVVGGVITRASPEQAMQKVLGYTIAADLSVPHDSVYRPAIKQKCRDGFNPLGPVVTLRDSVSSPDELAVAVQINGRTASVSNTANLVRRSARLLSDISSFMTLLPGDVVLMGASLGKAKAKPGDTLQIAVDGMAPLAFSISQKGEAA